MQTVTLLCSCTDRTGIVAALTQFVARHGGNIVSLDQHSDGESRRFYMRLVWDLAGFDLARDEIPQAIALETKRFGDMRGDVFFSHPRPKVAVFASTAPHCLADLLLRQEMGEFAGDIALVVSNHESQRALVEHHGLPFRHVRVEDGRPEAAEAAHEALLAEFGVELAVLARYMRIIPPAMCARWSGRMINIHHSFLPAFVGAKPYHQAKARGVKIVGATAHYVTAELDQGPIIGQGVVEVSHRDEVEDLVRKGRDIERRVLSRAVRQHLQRRVLVEGRRTIVFDR